MQSQGRFPWMLQWQNLVDVGRFDSQDSQSSLGNSTGSKGSLQETVTLYNLICTAGSITLHYQCCRHLLTLGSRFGPKFQLAHATFSDLIKLSFVVASLIRTYRPRLLRPLAQCSILGSSHATLSFALVQRSISSTRTSPITARTMHASSSQTQVSPNEKWKVAIIGQSVDHEFSGWGAKVRSKVTLVTGLQAQGTGVQPLQKL